MSLSKATEILLQTQVSYTDFMTKRWQPKHLHKPTSN